MRSVSSSATGKAASEPNAPIVDDLPRRSGMCLSAGLDLVGCASLSSDGRVRRHGGGVVPWQGEQGWLVGWEIWGELCDP
jgi:hypothetical protein